MAHCNAIHSRVDSSILLPYTPAMDTSAQQTQHPKTILNEALVRTTLAEVMQAALPVAEHVQYCLVGTAATLLYGITIPAGDIDLLLRDRQDVELFAQALSAIPTATCLQPPIWFPGSRQYFARYEIKGAIVEFSTVEFDVEISNDWQECVGRGPWESPVLIHCGVYQIPTIAIELRLLTELSRQRPDRYNPILEYMCAHPCNIDLVQRGMIAYSIPQELQDKVMASLA